jgi:septum formation protein
MPLKLILASQSPARRLLLINAGVDFEVADPSFDEAAAKLALAHVSSARLAAELASGKALSVSRHHRTALVIGADQTLECDGMLLGKPKNRDEALAQLMQLRGRSHELHSAVVCARDGIELWRECCSARLTMRRFSDDFADAYVARLGDEVTQSVGGYKIEGLGLQLFEDIEGDYFTILGMPLLQLLAYLRRESVIAS